MSGPAEGTLNLLHYEDAAGAVVAALNAGSRVHGALFLVSDGAPMTRGEIIDVARRTSAFTEIAMPEFQASGSPSGRRGKVYDTSRLREQLKWSPRHASFAQFMLARAV